MENTGLYTKYHVRTPDEQPLDSGTFVLRPFNADGTVRDESAIKALSVLADQYDADGYGNAARGIRTWLEQPDTHPATTDLNVPES